jgi:NAD(P)-dependent dehydrogenase (short-subunit alcohol dehydrogenase family)
MRTILVTGGSSGIGLATAAALAARGDRVFATIRKGEDRARIEAIGARALILDLADADSVRRGLDELFAAAGQVDAVVHNAGYGQYGALEDVSRERLGAQFEANVFGAHQINLRVLPGMRARGAGRIVFVSSVLGLVAMRYRGAYVASKFALEGMADTLRLELAGSGIEVALVEPGPISTRFRANALAAFRAGIDVEASAHREGYVRFLARLSHEGQVDGMTRSPAACVTPILHALDARRPALRYPVTVPTRLFGVLRRILPGRMLDALLTRG